MSDIVERLIDTFGKSCVLTPEEASTRVASHWKQSGGLNCLALLLPETTEDVSKMLQICHEFHQPVVPHGGLTNVVGAADTHPNEIALSLERMNQVEQIDVVNKTVTVQAGVILQQLQDNVATHGQLFSLDLGAKGSCMIGGNIASNAGGLQALRYGVMRNLVLGLEVVLADGTVVSSLNKLMKNNAGYDLKQLFIGSEGTLGIITRAVLKLEERPKTRNTAFIAVDSFEKANDLLLAAKASLKNGLTSFELLWQDYYQLMTSKPSLFSPPLPQTYPFYVLLESLGYDAEKDKTQFEEFLEHCLITELIDDAAMAQAKKELDWFWGIRENVEFIFSIHRPVFLFDISLAISDMDAYIKTIRSELQSVWPDVHLYVFGHMGDGNLHLFVSCGEDDQPTKHRIEELLYKPLQPIGGSITGEHGIGLEKKPWLYLSRTSEEIALMRTIKKALDPRGILNPGKLLPE
ncbi:FAD-binding oxidoreductase [Spirosoma sp. BT702]|uniref:FAD-binding oxidoreductase n=1 Tax=Spirosoma profusum TaxID=2771354 RepID=A0A926Y2E4_9BACT|nr:FAD-binding oxidoreductase [Spirosoma profusum]MBD2700716.1 FAD-binding oxidoreductase [Spirosoma profusum]